MPNFRLINLNKYPLTRNLQGASDDINYNFSLVTGGGGGTGSGFPFSGSAVITGSLIVSGGNITGTLIGTASWAINALTASYFSGSISTAISASYATTASYAFNATSASYAFDATTASYALTASHVPDGITGTGSINYLAKFDGNRSITSSIFYDNGSAIGLGTTLPEGALDISYGFSGGGGALTLGADYGDLYTRTNNNRKYALVTAVPYTNTRLNTALLAYDSDGTDNILHIGGTGDVGVNSPTSIRFYTTGSAAADGTGSIRMVIDGTGRVGIGRGFSAPASILHASSSTPTVATFEHTTAPRIVLKSNTDDAYLSYNGSIALGYSAIHTDNILFVTNSGVQISGSQIALIDLPAATKSNVVYFDTTTKQLSYGTAGGGGTISGSGADGYIARFSGSSAISSSVIYESAGNIGIGTASPTAKLYIKDGVDTNLRLYGSSGTFVVSAENDAGSLQIPLNLNNTIRITATGNVGIGTTNPSTKLEVVGDAVLISGNNSAGGILNVFNGQLGFTAYQTLLVSQSYVDVSKLRVRGITAGSFNSTTYASIDDSGNGYFSGSVGIGITSPIVRLHVSASDPLYTVQLLQRGSQSFDPALPTIHGTPYLKIGGAEYYDNAVQSIGFGYNSGGSYQPVEIGYQVTDSTNFTRGDIVFATRRTLTNVAPTEKMRITSNGQIIFANYTGSGAYPGTSAATLAVDTNGNVITIVGGTLSGTGVTNYIPVFDSSTSIVTSSIYQDGTKQIGIGLDVPTSRLHVSSAANTIATFEHASAPRILLKGGADSAYLSYNGSIGLGFSSTHTNNILFISSSRVGIGTSIPAYKLDVSGSIRAFGYLIGVDDSSNIKYVFSNDGGDSYINTGGKVGINTTNPVGQLNVRHNGSGSSTVYSGLFIQNNNAAVGSNVAARIALDGDGSATGYGFIEQRRDGFDSLYLVTRNSAVGDMGFETSGSVRLFIKGETGNIGIGTTSPVSIGTGVTTVDIQGTSAGGIAFGPLGTKNYIYGGSTMYVEANQVATFWTNGSERIRITSTGNVGINTTNPNEQLDVFGNQWLGDGTVDTQLYLRGVFGTSYAWKVQNLGSGLQIISTSPTSGSGFNIDFSGNVGIGTTAPSGNLEIYASSSAITNNLVLTNKGVNAIDQGVSIRSYLGGGVYDDGGQILFGSEANYTIGNKHSYIAFSTARSGGNNEQMRISSIGRVTFASYTGSGAFPGTAAATLAVDTSGNILTIGGGTITGTGESGYLALFDSISTLTASAIFQTGSGKAAGRIGIGTDNPIGRLHVSGTSATVATFEQITPRIALKGGANTAYLSYNDSLALGFSTTHTNNILFVTNSGVTVSGSSIILPDLPAATKSNVVYFDTTTRQLSYGASGSNSGGTISGSGADGYIARFSGSSAISSSVIYESAGNIGIGTTNPQTGVKLDVYGSAAVAGGSEGLRIGNIGDNSAYDNVKIYYTGYNSGSPRIYLTPRTTPGSGIVESFFHIQNSNGSSTTSNNTMGLLVDGSVGIGTTSPSTKVHIYSALGPSLKLSASGSGTGGLLIEKGDSGTAYINNVDAVGMQFQIANSTKMIINPSGDIGIGTINPGYRLHVSGTIFSSGNGFSDPSSESGYRLKMFDNGGIHNDPGIGLDGAGGAGEIMWFNAYTGFYFNYGTQGVKVKFDSSGNVGINTTNPTQKLDVVGAGLFGQNGAGSSSLAISNNDQSNVRFRITNSGTGGQVFSLVGGNPGISNSGFAIYDETNTATRLYISSSGNVGIGTTNPGYKLDVNGTGRFSNSVTVEGQIISQTDIVEQIVVKRSSNTNNQVLLGRYSTYGYLQSVTQGSSYDPFVINPSGGNVGIGVTNPLTKLEIRGQQAATKDALLSLSKFDYGVTTLNQNYSNNFYANGKSLEIDIDGYNLLQLAVNNVANAGVVVIPTGSVGIGTSSPSYKLHVSGGNGFINSIILGDDSTYGAPYKVVGFNSVNDGGNRIVAASNTADGMYFMAATGRGFAFRPNGGTSDLFVINSSGQVGINTTSPTAGEKLHIVGGGIRLYVDGADSQNVGIYQANAANTEAFLWQQSSTGASLNLWAYSTTTAASWNNRVTFTATGRVGIGTTAPSGNLEIYASSSTVTSNLVLTNKGVNAVDQGISIQSYLGGGTYDDGGRILFGSEGNYSIGNKHSYIAFSTARSGGNNEQMRISSIGRVTFASYTGSGAFPGSAAASLAVDTSGNIITVGGGTITGTGESGYLALFDSISTLTASAIFQTGSGKANGRIGIGVDDPGAKLHISGTASTVTIFEHASAPRIALKGGADNAYLSYNGSIALGYSTTHTSNILFVTNSGVTISGSQISLIDLPAATKSNVVYFDTVTKQLSYGASGSGGGGTISGSGADGYIARFSGSSAISSSVIYESAGNIGINSISPNYKLDVNGTLGVSGVTTLTSDLNLSYSYPRINLTDTGADSDYSIINDDGRFSIYDTTNNAHRIYVLAAGNVGIGTTSPSAKLDVNGTGNFSSYITTVSATANSGSPAAGNFYSGDDSSQAWRGGIKVIHNADVNIAAGSSIGITFQPLASAGSIFYGAAKIAGVRPNATANNQDTDLAFFTRTGASNSTTDTENMRITAGGNVGIGTTNPGAKLDVYTTGDPTALFRANGDFSVNFRGSTTGSVQLFSIRNDSTAGVYLNTQNSARLALGVSTSGTAGTVVEQLTINSIGNVGINTTSPGEKLEVIGNIYVNSETSGIIVDASGNKRVGLMKYPGLEGALVHGNTTSLRFGRVDQATVTGGTFTTEMLINTSGQVGIGVTSPASILNTSGSNQGITHDDASTGKGYIRFRNSGTQLALFGIAGSWEGNTSQDLMIAAETGRNIRMYTDGSATVKMFISGSGNVGIGVISPSSRLHISGSSSTAITQILQRGIQGSDSGMSTIFGTPYLQIGGAEYYPNAVQAIGFGYTSGSSYQPVEIGYQVTDATSFTRGDLVFATRRTLTNVAPTEKMRITSNGQIVFTNYTGSGAWPGTPAATLGVDINGNIITTAGGALTGTGVANYIPVFDGISSLVTSSIYQDTNQIGIGLTVPTTRLHVSSSASTVATFEHATATRVALKASNSLAYISLSQSIALGYSTTHNSNILFITSSGITVAGSATVTQNVTASRAFISSSNGTVSGSTLIVYGSGSAQPVFTVQGSQGELFSVNDSLSGSLFSVNDISGLPIIEAFSDNRVLIGSYQAPMLTTTVRTTLAAGNNIIYQTIPTASYDAVFFEYSLKSGSNARAGSIMGIWSGSDANYTEVVTTDFGNTTGVKFMVMVTGSNVALTGSVSAGSWTMKTIIRSI